MASMLLTRGDSAVCDQTELLCGAAKGAPGACGGCGTPEEAASSFLALEESADSAGAVAGTGADARRGGKPALCATRRRVWLAAGVLVVAAAVAAAAAVTLQLHALRADVDRLTTDGGELRRELHQLRHRLLELELYSKLRQFEDEVYEMEDDGDGDEGVGEEGDGEEGEGEDDVDYYPTSEEVHEVQSPSPPPSPPPGPQHRGRFFPHYQHLLAAHALSHDHVNRKKPGVEAAAAEARAEAEAAEARAEVAAAEARSKREIGGSGPLHTEGPVAHVGGIPVLRQSYGSGARRVNDSEGLALYGGLVGDGDGEGDAAQRSQRPQPAPRLFADKMLRSGPWGRRERVRTGKESRAAVSSAAPSPPTLAPNVISRQSHVMQTATPAAPIPRRALPLGPAASGLQWAMEGPSTYITPPPAQVIVRGFPGATGGSKKRPVAKKSLGGASGGGPSLSSSPSPSSHALRRRPVFAAHYGGDTSSYSPSHEHYDGNGKLRHPNKVFSDWLASEWMNQLDMERKFSLNNGEVTVTDTGLYFIYAQIFYLDEKDTNGYRVQVNGKPVLQCIVTAGQPPRGAHALKANTCFTAGALYLASGDRVSLREVGDMRWTVFEPEKSFFGLVKLGHTARIQ